MLEVRRLVCAPYSVALCALCGTCVPERNTLAAVCTPPNPTTHCSRNDAALMVYRRWQLQLPATSPVPVSHFATIPSVAAQKVLRRIMSKGKHPSRARQPQCVCGDRASRPLPDCVVASMDTSAATRQHSRHQIVCESASCRGFVGCYQCATVPSPFARPRRLASGCYTWVRRHFRGQHKKCESRGITQRCQRYLQQFLASGITLSKARQDAPVSAQALDDPAGGSMRACVSSGASTSSADSFDDSCLGLPGRRRRYRARSRTHSGGTSPTLAPFGAGMSRVASNNSLTVTAPPVLPNRSASAADSGPVLVSMAAGALPAASTTLYASTSRAAWQHPRAPRQPSTPSQLSGVKRKEHHEGAVRSDAVKRSRQAAPREERDSGIALVRVRRRMYECNPVPVHGPLALLCLARRDDVVVHLAGYLPNGQVWAHAARLCPPDECDGDDGETALLYLPLPAPRLPANVQMRLAVTASSPRGDPIATATVVLQGACRSEPFGGRPLSVGRAPAAADAVAQLHELVRCQGNAMQRMQTQILRLEGLLRRGSVCSDSGDAAPHAHAGATAESSAVCRPAADRRVVCAAQGQQADVVEAAPPVENDAGRAAGAESLTMLAETLMTFRGPEATPGAVSCV